MDGNEPPQVDSTWADSVRINYRDLEDLVLSRVRTQEGNVPRLIQLKRRILQFGSHLQAVSGLFPIQPSTTHKVLYANNSHSCSSNWKKGNLRRSKAILTLS